MEDTNIIKKETIEEVSGGDGKGSGGSSGEAARHPIRRTCDACGSSNLDFLYSEYIKELDMKIKHYRCRDCGADT